MSKVRPIRGRQQNQPVQSSREIAQAMHRNSRAANSDDIFATNPLRRSFMISCGSWMLILLPAFVLRGDSQALILIGLGWIAAAGIIFVTPVFIWFLVEEFWVHIKRRTNPLIDELELSDRSFSLLYRHGYETIASVDRASDASLSLLSNMDQRTLREIRRSVNLWKYQRWQDRGFPQGETPESTI